MKFPSAGTSLSRHFLRHKLHPAASDPGGGAPRRPEEPDMNVFVVGASESIGRPLIAELIRQGHMVTGMSRSDEGARHLPCIRFDAPRRLVRSSKRRPPPAPG